MTCRFCPREQTSSDKPGMSEKYQCRESRSFVKPNWPAIRPLTSPLWERMLEEETQHFPRCVWSSRISVGARRAASRPCVSGSVDVPVLKDFPPTRVGMDRAGIGMPSRYPPVMHLLLRARVSRRLLKKMVAVAWVHRDVAIAMKNNGRDGGPVT